MMVDGGWWMDGACLSNSPLFEFFESICNSISSSTYSIKLISINFSLNREGLTLLPWLLLIVLAQNPLYQGETESFST